MTPGRPVTDQGRPRRRRGRALLACAAALAAATTGAAAATPATAATGRGGAGDRAAVVFLLRPGAPAVLAGLARQPHASARQRALALRAAAPTATGRAGLVSWLGAHGFTVTGQTTWSVQATADAATAAAQLGVRLVRRGGYLAHVGTLRPPPAIAAAVQDVVGLDDRPVFRHHALDPQVLPAGTLGSQGLRAAYDADPAALGAGATVATIQFSGWSPSDLTSYAQASGLSTTAAPGALHPTVTELTPGAATYTADDGDGDFEVALDQEALLATAPQAAQHIYFAGNSLTQFTAALAAVLSDVTSGQPVTALSVSWGACEPDLATADSTGFASIERQLQQLVTVGGVTVFAAAGDSGVHDCTPVLYGGAPNPDAGRYAVDFPASSPYVVAVGGTRLTPSGTGWTETAWGPAGLVSARVIAGGGGFSTTFPRSAAPWQVGVGGQYPAAGRAVPDIASAADPSAGLAVYNADHCGTSGWCLGGGTSAGAPVQAGLFASTLAAAAPAGAPVAGIGDIHAALYGDPAAFRDIVSGSNGGYLAGPGYDPVTGLGSPRWAALAPRLSGVALDAPYAVRGAQVPLYAAVAPAATAATWTVGTGTAATCSGGGSPSAPTAVTLPGTGDRTATVSVAAQTAAGCATASARVIVDATPPVNVPSLMRLNQVSAQLLARWSASDLGSGVALYRAAIRRYAATATTWSTQTAAPGRAVLSLPPAAMYLLQVDAVDRAGNVARRLSDWVKVPLDDAALRRGVGWSRVGAPYALAGAVSRSTTAGAALTGTFTSGAVWVDATVGPASGLVRAYVDGRYIRTVDLYSPTWHWQVPVLLWSGPVARHTLTLEPTGTHRTGATGSWVYVDGLLAR